MAASGSSPAASGAAAQQYCLRWNNHRSNLLTVFDQLLQNEAFTDVTLTCEGGTSVKCHKMVLAACSSYFQVLFTELPCRHPVVVLKDVRYSEMKAILEYMYRGEVNVAQDQLGALLKVAEALKIKGLVEDNTTAAATATKTQSGAGGNGNTASDDPNVISTSSAANASSVPHSSGLSHNSDDASPPHSTPYATPHSTGIHQQPAMPKSPYMYGGGKSSMLDRSGVSMPLWGLPLAAPPSQHRGGNNNATAAAALNSATAAALNNCYNAAAMFSSDMSPLSRKKLSSMMASRDTPILRTVLGQGGAQGGQGGTQGGPGPDSSQPVPLVCRPDSHLSNHNDCYSQDAETSVKSEQMHEDTASPYTDISAMDEDEKNNKLAFMHSTSPQSMYNDGTGGVSSAIATYVPTQKPEWKRYKQYTRADILSAIEAVRLGMSALQAARKYGVPSRTLYDKVKKLGITTSRPFRRGSANGNGNVGLNYSFPGPGSGGAPSLKGDPDDPAAQNYMRVEYGGFLQYQLIDHHNNGGGKPLGDLDREPGGGGSTGGGNHSGNSSSPNNVRSPSPNLIKYAHAHRNSITPSPSQQSQGGDEDDDDEERGANDKDDEDMMQDQVEDLSVSRKTADSQPPPPPSRVIMPPMSEATAALLTTGSDSHQSSRD
ncbi:longitudinals lacking protein, isoforms H/M/V [Nilaparvata lugens]|uniref:longitudinals lacking protein, isoforms H/M/V n=1 Tax=Nilaparvata lugens TaxID=108931 RepID=UPI00193EBF90|nr:longitudinals lacking protein, isoforms H/M/V [Nilaparvata lugens]XP_039295259.1 longitudinals lacking protein, isoforms H/M/V [Nilaparvata lugens]XP_039295260.1 longitudinals lacking protein, isoforms H/M/V [Nilaparvata lugens]